MPLMLHAGRWQVDDSDLCSSKQLIETKHGAKQGKLHRECTWRFAGKPTNRSPLSVKATTEGVVRAPSAFSMTLGVCTTAILNPCGSSELSRS